MLKHPLLVIALLAAAPACGRKDEKDSISEQTPRSQDASPQTVALDGKAVPFLSLGETVTYEGALAAQDGAFLFTAGRAFTLAAPATLFVRASSGASADCAAADYGGPSYMVLRIRDGAEPEIVRSTEGIEAGGNPIPATELATFPGALDAGTYVLTVDYVSLGKACAVKGGFTLAE